MSKGGVINANFGLIKGRYRPGVAGLTLVGQVMSAWLEERTFTGTSIFPYECSGAGGSCRPGETDSTHLGTEVDVAANTVQG